MTLILKSHAIRIKFQSTHPRRVWLCLEWRTKTMKKFQSTHPRRVWLFVGLRKIQVTCFNPHTHAGCDNLLNTEIDIWLCFNPHTHAGCDLFSFAYHPNPLGFNPHTHAGCDQIENPPKITIFCFNPHTHAGCDNIRDTFDAILEVSIHTPTQGVTDKIYKA